MRRTAWILTACSLLAAAIVAPAVASDAWRADASRADRRAPEHGSPFAVEFEGTATDREGAVYRVSMAGEGRLLSRSADNQTHVKGMVVLHAVVTDANGTVVAERDLRARVRAHETEDGHWRWQLVSRGETRFTGIPKLLMYGNATGPTDGALALEGQGFALIRSTSDGSGPLRLRVDVDGSMTRTPATA